MTSVTRAGVAAGHRTTAEAGAAILDRGGNAVDAAVAMMLVSCAAETIFTGLGAVIFVVVLLGLGAARYAGLVGGYREGLS